MAATSGLGPLIEVIYDAALDGARLPALAEEIARATGACSSTLTWLDGYGQAESLSFNGGDAEAMRSYYDYWHEHDPWIAASARWPKGVAMNTEDVLPIAEYRRTAFYNEFIRPWSSPNIVRCAGALIPVGGQVLALGVQREALQQAFGSVEVQALQAMIPHLARMVALRHRLSEQERTRLRLEAMLDSLTLPVIRVDRGGRLLSANVAGEALLRARDGLVHTPQGLLDVEMSADRPRLQGAIAWACAGAGGSVAVARPSGRRALAVIVLPMPADRAVLRGEALVLVSDPERRPSSLSAQLRRLFGLSEAEAEVAMALSSGDSLGEISQARRVKISTLRTQVAHILAKTETARQAELAALIGRLTPLV